VVRLRHGEADAIAACIGLDVSAFTDRFTRLLKDRSGLSLAERDDGTCVFLDPEGCRIEAAKPLQCRDFPLRWNEPGWETRCASARQMTERTRELAGI
jgi:Fe-S-cluster containining protein